MRTNTPLALVEADISYQSTRLFTGTAAHEARHAWQFQLLTRTGSPYANDEDVGNFAPDNNDDWILLADLEADGETVCLPDETFLADGVTDLRAGSGGELRDDPDNREFPNSFAGDAFLDFCLAGTPGLKARERDAIRFGRALESIAPN